VSWLQEHNEGREPRDRLVPAAVLLAATARAAADAPTLNGHWVDGDLAPATGVHLGLVIALRSGGLLVPVITDADRRPVADVMATMADLVRRARSGHLRSAELRTPSISVSNLGDQGGDAVFGTIYPPQVALVGFGRVAERPWAAEGMLGVRPVVTASVAGDHRANEGHQASRFLARVAEWLQEPQRLEEDR
jgi:pyruvate dehydrogenase E2 component (dihydrolipoamide acetyltransferase)